MTETEGSADRRLRSAVPVDVRDDLHGVEFQEEGRAGNGAAPLPPSEAHLPHGSSLKFSDAHKGTYPPAPPYPQVLKAYDELSQTEPAPQKPSLRRRVIGVAALAILVATVAVAAATVAR